ncbi:MAG: flagellar biosynthesis anti-sigma factor FlgM [Pseudomonadota bacterium]
MKPTDTGQTTGARIEPASDKLRQSAASGIVPEGKSADSADRVTLTPAAENVRQTAARLETLPDVDQARVEAVKAAISAGTFEVDAQKIAERLLQSQKDLG